MTKKEKKKTHASDEGSIEKGSFPEIVPTKTVGEQKTVRRTTAGERRRDRKQVRNRWCWILKHWKGDGKLGFTKEQVGMSGFSVMDGKWNEKRAARRVKKFENFIQNPRRKKKTGGFTRMEVPCGCSGAESVIGCSVTDVQEKRGKSPGKELKGLDRDASKKGDKAANNRKKGRTAPSSCQPRGGNSVYRDGFRKMVAASRSWSDCKLQG